MSDIATIRAEVCNLLSRYGHAADDQSPEDLREVFSHDAILVPATSRSRNGIDDILDYFLAFVPSQPVRTIAHHMTNVYIEEPFEDSRIRVRSKTLGIRADMGFVTGEYVDLLIRGEHGLRIQERRIIRRSPFSTDRLEAE